MDTMLLPTMGTMPWPTMGNTTKEKEDPFSMEEGPEEKTRLLG
jgi:hypothetical protein